MAAGREEIRQADPHLHDPHLHDPHQEVVLLEKGGHQLGIPKKIRLKEAEAAGETEGTTKTEAADNIKKAATEEPPTKVMKK